MKVGLKDLTCNWPFEDKNELEQKNSSIFSFALPCKSMAYTIWCNFHACIHLWNVEKTSINSLVAFITQLMVNHSHEFGMLL